MNRPKQVFEFLGWHRQLERRPHIENIQKYGDMWLGWHQELKKREDYQDMIKGGGNGIFLLILALRWWMDETDEMEVGERQEWSNKRLDSAVRELEESLAGICGSDALKRALEYATSEEEDSEVESSPMKR